MRRRTFFPAARRTARWLGGVLLLSAATLPGCKTWDWGLCGGEPKTEAKVDPDYDLPGRCRGPGRDLDFMGVSDRSRQIESNLGVGR